MDISTASMLLVQKIASLGWNISDYKYVKEEENEKTEDSSTKANVGFTLSPHLKKCALKEVPSFFHYMAYILFPINVNVGMIYFYYLIFLGPVVEYAQYLKMVEQKEIPSNSNRLKLYFHNLILGLVFLIYWFYPYSLDFVKNEVFYDIDAMHSKSVVGVNYFKWNKRFSLFQRILMVEIAVHWSRYKFSMKILFFFFFL
jgi:hypothetical protein